MPFTNETFTVLADHDGVDTDSYDLKINGVVSASRPVADLSGGTITFPNTLITTPGNHNIVVAAVGPGGTTDSAVLVVNIVQAAPGAPVNVRITVP